MSRNVAELIFIQNIYIPGQKQKQPEPTPSPAAPAPAREITDEDKGTLQSLLGDVTTSAVLALYDSTVASGNTGLDPKANSVKFPQMEREDRGRVHKVDLPSRRFEY